MNKHLNDRQLLSYTDEKDKLSPRHRKRADAHLHDCPACRARLEHTTRTATNLAATLWAVGEQTPLAAAPAWNAIAQQWPQKRARRLVLPFRPLLRYTATLAVLALIVGGLAGLIRTMAVTGPATQATPTPTPFPENPSPAPGPLPHTSPDTTPISILILGIDGESDASDETDALMLLYLDAETERAFLLSIPRNLYVQTPGDEQTRAGSVYRLGEQSETGDGLALAREMISATLGLAVEHTALLHLDSFVTLIDTIGGVDVEVTHPIDDPDFPDGHGGSDPFSIPGGARHFDGATALRYARTLVVPATGFDRAFRQRQLALAVHDRVIQFDLLPDLIAQAPTLWATIAGDIETDLSLSDVIDLALLATNLTTADVTTATLDECCTVPHITQTGRRVLLPQPDEIETMIQSLLEEKE